MRNITHPFHMGDKNGSQDKRFLGSVTFKMRKKRYQSLDKHKEEACIKVVLFRHFFIESEQKYLKFGIKST